jgi:hypothetical protein
MNSEKLYSQDILLETEDTGMFLKLCALGNGACLVRLHIVGLQHFMAEALFITGSTLTIPVTNIGRCFTCGIPHRDPWLYLGIKKLAGLTH